MESREESIGIWFTSECNLDCTYCYIKNKNNSVILSDKAMEIIEEKLNAEGGLAVIMFMGAEPLTHFDELRDIVEMTKERKWKRKYLFNLATNGTLLTDEMKQWFRYNKDIISVGLSYDGNDEHQNSNRSGSSVLIDKKFFIDTWPKQPWKVTISEASAPDIDKGLIDIHEQGAIFTANVEYGCKPWKENVFHKYESALFRLGDYYAEHPDIDPCNIMQLEPYELIQEPLSVSQRCYCSAGESFEFFDMNKNVYPCHMLSPLVLAEERALYFERFAPDTDFEDPRCKNCFLKHRCYTCMGDNYAERGDIRLRSEMHCRIYQIEIRALMHMYIKKLMKKPVLNQIDAKNIKAMEQINDAFAHGAVGMKSKAK